MPTRKPSAKSATHSPGARRATGQPYSYCSLPIVKPREFPPGINPNRLRLILVSEKKWVNGTVLHYYFFDGPASWTGSQAEKNVARQAFQAWKNVGIGMKFEEVNSRDNAEVRIGFLRGDGSWSYVGRDILTIGRDERTMNFGWDISEEIDTAIHEIGHTLGFPHEHQNPNAGIVWDEETVYQKLAGSPNFWARETTFNNIIRKIDPDTVQGSNWDPDSIMHYPFEAGMILQPEQYRNGLTPAGGLSARDREWVKTFYAPLSDASYQELQVLQSVALSLVSGQQANFIFKPTATRRYSFGTFGTSDTVMVLFEEDASGNARYLAGDDDSGADRNAFFRLRLFSGRKYLVRVRLYYADRAGETAVMVW